MSIRNRKSVFTNEWFIELKFRKRIFSKPKILDYDECPHAICIERLITSRLSMLHFIMRFRLEVKIITIFMVDCILIFHFIKINLKYDI